MIRIFLPPEELASGRIIITGENARHLALVLRVQPGETLTALDGRGFRYECRVVSVHKKEVVAEVIRKESYSAESSISITLAQGIPKGEKMDIIVQKSTELGVSKIIPLITERSLVRHTHRVARWRKIALAASQQSGRAKIPEVESPRDFMEFLRSQAAYDHPALHPFPPRDEIDSGNLPPQEEKGKAEGGLLKIIFAEGHEERNLKKLLRSFGGTGKVTLLVGPEGGFSGAEAEYAVRTGFIRASLGPRILRTETAPLSAISIIQYELGDMG
ncbi:MAG: 16S rRNA (uracil(1498)-N(3))-methyltransferase [Deferribacteres bacterium]|nr:16S rRNA (uracil(1498)-N(3))-methyltransferase [Deferribacteres bacterium]